MRKFFVFLAIVFSVYGSVSYYIYTRGRTLWSGLPAESHWHTAYPAVFIFLTLSFPIARLLQRRYVNRLTDNMVLVGSFWLAAWVYFLVAALICDLGRGLLELVSFFGLKIVDPVKAGIWAGPFLCGAALVTVVIGCVNARRPVVRTVRVDIPLEPEWDRLDGWETRIALATDIHLGSSMSRMLLRRVVGQINAMEAEVVLLAGDIVDEDLTPAVKEDMGRLLRDIRSRCGTLAVTGNHEYIGGIKTAVAYLEDHKIVLLRDSYMICGNLAIVGREDHMKAWTTGKGRAGLDTILQSLDRSRPIIVMDHQPIRLREAVDNRVTLQVSGHTHHGQLWPVSLITRAAYECDWGLFKKGNTHFYVSCGAGTWGPPVRTSCRPEVVMLELHFGKIGEVSHVNQFGDTKR